MPTHRWPLVVVLAAATVAMIWTNGPGWPARDSIFLDFGLSRDSLAAGHWWSLLSHGLLHDSWGHGLLNLAGLWVVGSHVCDRHGALFFTAMCGAGVVAGGLAQVVANPTGILIGTSGGVFALVVAAGFLWDDRMIALRLGPWRFAVFRGRHLGWGVLLASALTVLLAPLLPDGGISIGHACHAGAACAGALVVGLARAIARPAPAIFLP